MWISVAALLGDAAGNLGLAPWLAPLAVWVAALLAGAALLQSTGCRWSVAVFAFAFAAVVAHRVYDPHFDPQNVARLPRASFTIEASVRGAASGEGERSVLLLDAMAVQRGREPQPLSGIIRLSIRHTHKEWHRGQKIRVRMRLHRPRPFGTPGEFDIARHFARRRIYVTAFADNDDEIEADGDAPTESRIDAWRRRIARGFHDGLEGDTANVLASLVIGDDQALGQPLRDAFNRAGVGHVLSISGLHMSLVALTSFRVLRWLLARSEHLLIHASVPKLAALLSALPLFVYAELAGSNVATLRSAVMATLVTGGILLDREARTMNSLAAAALLVLLESPGASAEVSFQLSFAAVLGIALAVRRFWLWWPQIEEAGVLRLRRERWVRWARPAALSVAVSFGAMSATLTLATFHFNQVSLVAPLANAIVVPVLGDAGVIAGLLAAMVIVIAPSAAAPFVLLAGGIVRFGLILTQFFAALPYAAVRIITPTWVEIGICYAALACSLLGRSRWRRLLMLLTLAVAILDVVPACVERLRPRRLRVSFVSVGQGDCAVVEFPNGAVMVVDGGGLGDGSFDVGERVVAPFLWQRRVARVDYIVATHPDWDHFGGLRFVAQQFEPRQVWTSGAGSSRPSYLAFERAAAEAGALNQIVRRGDAWNIGGVDVAALSPAHLDAGKENDASLVLRLAWHGVSVLLTGDIEAAAEAALVHDPGVDLRSTVLKVAHHGSKTSSTGAFVEAVLPSFAVISAGFENHFGFPHPDVVQRYGRLGSQLWRTDLDGTLTLEVGADGEWHFYPALARTPPDAVSDGPNSR